MGYYRVYADLLLPCGYLRQNGRCIGQKTDIKNGNPYFCCSIRSCRDITEHVGASCISGNAGSRGIHDFCNKHCSFDRSL
ncbi:unknown [Firmicutes bacterium CAG:238]|nr:unknown [Firmicutes bacterium CAG:238]